MIELFPKATKINKKNLYVYVVILFCVYSYIINNSQETIIFLSWLQSLNILFLKFKNSIHNYINELYFFYRISLKYRSKNKWFMKRICYFINNQSTYEVKFFIGDFAFGSTYLLIKSCKRSSESLKSLAWWLFACL